MDFSKYTLIPGTMGAKEYYGTGYFPVKDAEGIDVMPKHYVTYLISAYPDYADGGQYVTRIEITDPKVEIMGITVNSTEDEFSDVFSNMGCTISKKAYAAYSNISATKDNVTYTLATPNEGTDGQPMLTIQAEVTNREGIQF
ncbi:MAG: hypothetical protein IKL00_09685 [Oscillospiraceae bacterium]|nr:hypothetical protein [Oscillospiraceae bacterium]